MRFVLCEKSIEMITDAPHAGEYESLEDAKRAADRHQEFLSTELAHRGRGRQPDCLSPRYQTLGVLC